MRDFFYNKGDVFIAVLIILIAAFVIYIRVGVIMDYSASGNSSGGLLPMPPGMGNTDTGQSGGGADANAGAGSDVNAGAGAATDQAGQGQDGQTAQTGDASAQSPAAPQTPDVTTDSNQPAQTETPPAQQPGASTVQITVSAGDAASTIADKLLAAGAITDKQAFIAEVLSEGADSKLKMGTFTIPAGSSFADIIKILVG